METIAIGDACEVLNGYAFKSEKYTSSGIRIIRIANVQKGYIEDNSPVFYPIDSGGLEKYMLREGDLLVSLTGNVGRTALLTKDMLPAALNQRVACLRLKTDKITNRFLFHLLNSNYFETKCIQSSQGVAQKNMSTEWLKSYKLPLYSLSKQNEITKILDNVRNTNILKNQELKRYDDLIKARFVEMFGDENNSKCWDIMHVEDVADVQVGVVIKPAQYYTNECKRIKAFRSLNIGEGYIKNSDWVYFSEDGNKKNNKSILKENDILIVRSGAPGTSCVVTKEYEGCNAIDIIIARPNCEKINPYYLCTFTNMPHGKKQIVEGTGGAAQQHFNVGKYNKLQLMLPPKDLQFKFEQFLKQVDKSKFHCFHQKIRETFQVSQKLTFLLKFYSTCVLWYKVIQYATSIFRQRLLIHIQEGNEYHHLISSYIVP